VLLFAGNHCFVISSLNALLNIPVLVKYVDELSALYENRTRRANVAQEMERHHFPESDDDPLQGVFLAFATILSRARVRHCLFGESSGWERPLLMACDACRSRIADGRQHDADEFIRLVLSAMEYVSVLVGLGPAYTAMLQITSRVLTNNSWRNEYETSLLITTEFASFEDVVASKYIDTERERTRVYGPLPIVLTAINDRDRLTGAAKLCSFPVEFHTVGHMRYDRVSYGFSAAIIHIGQSLESGHYVSVVRRGNNVYVLDDNNITGHFDVHSISKHLSQVVGHLRY
jgi:hypothetical protein